MDPCTKTPLQPQKTITVNPVQGDVAGKFVYEPEEALPDLIIKLRVMDLSRQELNYGTEIPVIDQMSAARRPLQLLDVVTGADFRSLIRVYDFDPAPGHAVRVRVFLPSDGFGDDSLLSESVLPLRVSVSPEVYPGYGELSLGGLSGISRTGNVRVEVAPLTEGLRFWAFASVTNNLTQHVTIVTP